MPLCAASTFIGYANVGGIVGEAYHATIEDCTVGANVWIRTVKSSACNHGGIVGLNDDGSVRQCISSARLTVANGVTNCIRYGGIAGWNEGSITDCLAIDAVIPNVNGRGAILGYKSSSASLTRNYYYNCKVASDNVTPSGVGLGNENSNVTSDVNDIQPLYAITLGTHVTLDRTASATLPGTNNRTYDIGADINGQPYGYATATVSLGYGGEVPSGMTPVYSATNGGTISGSTLTMPASSVTVSARLGSTSWVALQTQFDNASTDANSPTTITLDGDVTASSNDTYLELKGGRQVILDLNGHTIDRHMTAAQEGNGHVIQVSGSSTSLTIRDSGTGGTITGGWSRYGAGCINATNGATLRLEGGTISGNRVSENGGTIYFSGNFYMTGGTITGNAANLVNNNNIRIGGALYFGSSGDFYMSGGSITGNYCGTTGYGAAGIGCFNGTLTFNVHLSGSYNISGNQQGTYDSSNGTWSNLSPSDILNHDHMTYVIDGAISPSQPARMIIDAHDSKATITNGWSTYMSGEDPELVFTLANPNGQGIGVVGGEATICTLHTISLATGLTATPAQAVQGKRITLSGAPAPSNTGGIDHVTDYIVVYNDGSYDQYSYSADANSNATFLMPDANVSVTSESYNSVSYIDEVGDEQTCTNFTLITSSNDNVTLNSLPNSNWYVVSGDVTINGELRFTGSYWDIIICDGASLTVNSTTPERAAIYSNDCINIFGQTLGSGTISATGDYCGIFPSGNFNIFGSTVRATGSKYGIYSSSVFNIARGTVIANSTDGDGIHGSDVNINGGNVSATSTNANGIVARDILTLGWSSSTDRITASSYGTENGTIRVMFGQILTDGTNYYSGTLNDTQIANIAGQTLQPFVPTGVTIADDHGVLTATFDGTSTTALNIPSPITMDNVTYNRTFTAGKASTVMLPFDYTCNGNEGGTFYRFVGVEEKGNTWVATMQATGDGANNTSTLTANTPYLFMPTGTTITFGNIPYSGVTLCTEGGGNCQTADAGSHWTFKGTYDYIKWTSDTGDQDYSAERAAEIGKVYGFAGVAKPEDNINVGDFVRVASGAQINPMRAYLMWSDTPNSAHATNRGASAAEELPSRITVRLLDADGVLTNVGEIDIVTGEVSFEGWYTLQGVKLDAEPTQPGIYINNGKKVSIK